MRVAAIALLLLGAGSLVILNNNKDTTQPRVATTTAQPGVKPTETNPAITTPQKQILASENSVRKNFAKATEVKNDPVQIDQPDNDLQPNDQLAYSTATEVASTVPDNIQKTTRIVGTPQEIINDNPVTIRNASSLNSIAGPAAVNTTEVANSDGKQGSVRGLLRKATRFIERRTGINPVDEDDKLLVGMVAISLK
jgi:hypothetical protein